MVWREENMCLLMLKLIVCAFLAVPLTRTLQVVLAAQAGTRPVAIMLPGGPPEERRPPKDELRRGRVGAAD